MSSTSDVWVKSSLSSFPTHQHRHASMERMRQAGQKWQREDPLAALATSLTGLNDLVGGWEEGCPQMGTPEAYGVHGAVRDDLLGKLVLARGLELLDGENLSVDIKRTVLPVAPDKSKGFHWGVPSEDVVRYP